MRKIQMVDLKSQYEGIKEIVNQSIQEILENTSFINGPQVHAFQKGWQKVFYKKYNQSTTVLIQK